MNYLEQFEQAIVKSKQLGIDPKISEEFPINRNNVDLFRDLADNQLIHMLVDIFGLGDWGNNCMNVSAQLFTILQHYNIPCELTYGDVFIGKTQEYDVSISGLINEWESVSTQKSLAIHVWVTVGKDYIIDPTICSRIHKYYDSKCPQNHVFWGEAEPIKEQMGIVHRPLLVGKNYLERIAEIPLEYKSLEQLA
ncbi:hypothetical protein H4F20_20130 [Vibrio sp. 16]|uniref:hypothetical protein n=1 Tax=Vibrio sp. 16 TaxID=391586 RepID=UPI002FF3B9C9